MINCQKHLFYLDDKVTYLNCAYQAPLLKSGRKALEKASEKKMYPHTLGKDDFFVPNHEIRSLFSDLINAKDPDRIAVIPSVSYGIATVVANLEVGPCNNVVVVEEQFPSNIYSWMTLCSQTGAELKTAASPKQSNDRAQGWNQNILDAIDENTAVVTLGNVHWADGTRFDLKAIRKRCDEVNALLIIDGTQSIGALDFDVQDIRPDAVLCAGYKWLFGPYSIGLAYYSEKFDNGRPIEDNWIIHNNCEQFEQLVNYDPTYLPKSGKFQAGEYSNFFLAPVLLDSLKQILQWSTSSIQEYCDHITGDSLKLLTDAGFSVEDKNWRGTHLFGIRLPDGLDVPEVKKVLQEEQIFVSVRGNSLRVSPHVYNTQEDMAKLTNCLLNLKTKKSTLITSL